MWIEQLIHIVCSQECILCINVSFRVLKYVFRVLKGVYGYFLILSFLLESETLLEKNLVHSSKDLWQPFVHTSVRFGNTHLSHT